MAQDEWVHHLVNKFGPASSGGVKYYAMDNEPEIWIVEEQDVRPAELSYEQMRDMHLDYATAIKDVDPSALITGPVTWHWLTLQYSPLDRGNDNYKTHADFNAHNKVPFMEWWLAQIKAHDDKAGRRSLDVLDIHLYPQGNVYSDGGAAPALDTRAVGPDVYRGVVDQAEDAGDSPAEGHDREELSRHETGPLRGELGR